MFGGFKFNLKALDDSGLSKAKVKIRNNCKMKCLTLNRFNILLYINEKSYFE